MCHTTKRKLREIKTMDIVANAIAGIKRFNQLVVHLNAENAKRNN